MKGKCSRIHHLERARLGRWWLVGIAQLRSIGFVLVLFALPSVNKQQSCMRSLCLCTNVTKTRNTGWLEGLAWVFLVPSIPGSMRACGQRERKFLARENSSKSSRRRKEMKQQQENQCLGIGRECGFHNKKAHSDEISSGKHINTFKSNHLMCTPLSSKRSNLPSIRKFVSEWVTFLLYEQILTANSFGMRLSLLSLHSQIKST